MRIGLALLCLCGVLLCTLALCGCGDSSFDGPPAGSIRSYSEPTTFDVLKLDDKGALILEEVYVRDKEKQVFDTWKVDLCGIRIVDLGGAREYITRHWKGRLVTLGGEPKWVRPNVDNPLVYVFSGDRMLNEELIDKKFATFNESKGPSTKYRGRLTKK